MCNCGEESRHNAIEQLKNTKNLTLSIGQLFYQNFNQKFLANGGVQLYFSNVFDQTGKSKVPTIKRKLRKILVDYGLCQTCLEINQRLDFIKVWYIDEFAQELKSLLLQRFNRSEKSQAIELSINLEGSLVNSPSKEVGIKTYAGLTELLYQEFVQQIESRSLVDDDPYNQMKTIIQKGNFAPTMPLESILRGELG